MASQFRHKRARNSGLVYEFLVRRLSKSMIDGDRATYHKTLEVLNRYYSEGTVLSEERELFDVIKNSRGLTESAARRILTEVQKHARKMDARKIDIKKSCLIKEINYAFGKGFFAEHRIPDYRLLASIQMVIDACRNDSVLTESVSKIQLEEGLVLYMTSKGEYQTKPVVRSEVDELVMRMAAKRFDEKYSRSLGPAQKVLLERYIRYQVSGDELPLRKFIASETERVTGSLDRALSMKEVREDKVMLERLTEAKSKFNKSKDLDVIVEELMLFQALSAEVDADE